MSKTVYIDEEECIGCGSCVEICPEVFHMKEGDEKAEVIKPEGGPKTLSRKPWIPARFPAFIGRSEGSVCVQKYEELRTFS
jgi:ferredoxin